jgi:hypothetical protein
MKNDRLSKKLQSCLATEKQRGLSTHFLFLSINTLMFFKGNKVGPLVNNVFPIKTDLLFVIDGTYF